MWVEQRKNITTSGGKSTKFGRRRSVNLLTTANVALLFKVTGNLSRCLSTDER